MELLFFLLLIPVSAWVISCMPEQKRLADISERAFEQYNERADELESKAMTNAEISELAFKQYNERMDEMEGKK